MTFTPSDCGNFEGEVFVAEDGTYLGDFRYGQGTDSALGFTRSTNQQQGIQMPDGSWCGGLFLGVAGDYWEAPNLGNYCLPGGTSYYDTVRYNSYFLPNNIAEQPIVPVSIWYGGSLDGRIVVDYSGPRSLEHLPAYSMEGTGTESNLTWIGKANSLAGGFPDKSLLNWRPVEGSKWVYQGWVKTVPDRNGWLADGHDLLVGDAPYGYVSRCESAVTLSSEWQFFKHVWTVPPGGDVVRLPVFEMTISYTERRRISFSGITTDWTKWAPRGKIHLKCVHLYPLGAQPIAPSGGGAVFDPIKFRTSD